MSKVVVGGVFSGYLGEVQGSLSEDVSSRFSGFNFSHLILVSNHLPQKKSWIVMWTDPIKSKMTNRLPWKEMNSPCLWWKFRKWISKFLSFTHFTTTHQNEQRKKRTFLHSISFHEILVRCLGSVILIAAYHPQIIGLYCISPGVTQTMLETEKPAPGWCHPFFVSAVGDARKATRAVEECRGPAGLLLAVAPTYCKGGWLEEKDESIIV